MKRQYHKSGNLRLKAVILNATAVTCMGVEGYLKGMVSMTQSNAVCTWRNRCLHHWSLQWWVRTWGTCHGSPRCGSLGAWCGHITWLWWSSWCSVVFLGLAVDESTECVRTETTKRVFFRKKKKVSTRCTTNRMTVKHEGDHDENRVHVLLLTLKDNVPFS